MIPSLTRMGRDQRQKAIGLENLDKGKQHRQDDENRDDDEDDLLRAEAALVTGGARRLFLFGFFGHS